MFDDAFERRIGRLSQHCIFYFFSHLAGVLGDLAIENLAGVHVPPGDYFRAIDGGRAFCDNYIFFVGANEFDTQKSLRDIL